MDSAEFANTTQTYFGDVTFAEAFAISKRAVSIQVSVGSGHGFVLNHFTAPQVVVRTAVNVTGDSVVSLVVAHSEKQFDESVFLDPNADADTNQGGTSERELLTPTG